jgi:hypothetical protein
VRLGVGTSATTSSKLHGTCISECSTCEKNATVGHLIHVIFKAANNIGALLYFVVLGCAFREVREH